MADLLISILFFVGPYVIGGIVLLVLLIRHAATPSKPTQRNYPPVEPPVPNPTQLRRNTLQIVQRETTRAFQGGNIRKDTHDDMEQYLAGQHARLENLALPVRPAPKVPPPEPVPIPLSAHEAARQLPVLLAQTPAETQAERKEDPVTPLAGVAPHAPPVQPAPAVVEAPPHLKETPMLDSSSTTDRPAAGVTARERSWAERFFTPENVRILQSLGIGIIFLSAVAFVRTEMWNGASGWSQLLMLAAGTVCCSGLGLLLLRVTSLRLTGLCFLILGQLGLLVDLYAARVFHAPSGQPFYTYSFSSLWTLGFTAFAITAYIQARWTKESLFDAFAYFGVLAAWGAGMIWLGASAYVLPASFVPMLLLSTFFARRIAGTEAQPRWSLAWWITSGVSLSAPLLCIALPLAALLSGQTALARDFHWHALAILGLSAALLKDAFRSGEKRNVHVPAVLLLSITPLGVYAFNGLTKHVDLWPLALTLPGLLLIALAILLARTTAAERKPLFEQLGNWGFTSLMIGLILSVPIWVSEGSSTLLVVASLSIASGGLLRAFALREHFGAWLFMVSSVFALTQILQLNSVSLEVYHLAGLLLASVVYTFWHTLKTPDLELVSRHGKFSADFLALISAVALFLTTPLYGFFAGTPLSPVLHAAWVLLAAYTLLTSLLTQKPVRRFCGTLLLAFAVVPPQLTLSSGPLPSAPWLAITSVLATLLTLFLNNREKNANLLKAGLYGCVSITAYGTALSLLEFAHGRSLSAGIGLILQSCSLASLAMILRSRVEVLNRACATEVLALLQFALGLSFTAHHLGVAGTEWALASVLISALVLFAGLALESFSGAWLGEKALGIPSAFLESRLIAVCICAGLTLLVTFSGHALRMPQLDSTWRVLFGVSLLSLYFTFANSSRDVLLNRGIRWAASIFSYCALIPVTYLLFLKAHSTGSSWGALWFLSLSPVLMLAGTLMRREKEAGLSNAAFAGSFLVASGSLLLAFTNNAANLAGVPCATLLGIGALALAARKIHARSEFTVVANIAWTGAAFYALRAIMGTHAWASQASVWEMPYMAALGLATLALGGWLKLEPRSTPHENQSVVAWHGWVVTLFAAVIALFHLMSSGSHVAGGMLHNTDRLDALIVSIALLAPAFLLARRYLELHTGRYWASACAGLAYVMQVWKEQPAAWEWYTLPLALFLFALAWETARNEKSEGATEINGLLGVASVFALLPSFIQALPWNPADLWHVLTLAVIGFSMLFVSLATRRKVPLLTASGAILACLLVHAIHLAMNRQMLLPVGGLIAGFSVLAVASLFESRMNANVRSAVDRARAEARMFWTSWN